MVGPKKQALAVAEGQLKAAEDALAIKKAQLVGRMVRNGWCLMNPRPWIELRCKGRKRSGQ